MSDFVVSISQITSASGDKEKLRVGEQLRTQALLRFETSALGTSDGAGTWLTLWSGTVPVGASVGLKATLIGRGTSLGAFYEIVSGFQNFAGTTTYVGATFNFTITLTDNVLIDARWALAGDVVSLQVNDASLQAMNWKAFISGVTTV